MAKKKVTRSSYSLQTELPSEYPKVLVHLLSSLRTSSSFSSGSQGVSGDWSDLTRRQRDVALRIATCSFARSANATSFFSSFFTAAFRVTVFNTSAESERTLSRPKG